MPSGGLPYSVLPHRLSTLDEQRDRPLAPFLGLVAIHRSRDRDLS